MIRRSRNRAPLAGPVLGLAISLLLGLAAGMPVNMARAAVGGPAAGADQVVIGIAQAPDTLNPLFAQTAAAQVVMATIFTVDVQRNAAGTPFPQGVRDLPSVKDGTWRLDGERMTLLWQIRSRSWADGAPVGCGDYVFSHRVARDARVPIAVRDLTNRIAEVSCPDGPSGSRVRVVWKERYPHANLQVTEFGAIPRQALEPAFARNPAGLRTAPYGTDARATIGDGAYRLVEWRRGSSLTVEASGRHPIFGTPQIRRISWRVIADRDALVSTMLSGAIDAISTVGVTFEQAVQLQRSSAGHLTVFFEPGLTWEHLDFNLDHPLLQDLRIRRAIALAIDREQITQEVFGGRQPVAHSYLPPRHPGYTASGIQRYPYAPGRARALLQAAGFSPGADGLLRNAAGTRLSLELSTTAGHRAREQVEQIIQANLREVGIEITIRNYPARVFFGEITGRRKFPALAMYAWVMSPTSDCDQLYTSDGIPAEGNGWAGQNIPGYRSPEMDRLCKAAARELDSERRVRFLRASAALFSRDLPALPLYHTVSLAASKPALRNFLPVQIGATYETWNASRWSWAP